VYEALKDDAKESKEAGSGAIEALTEMHADVASDSEKDTFIPSPMPNASWHQSHLSCISKKLQNQEIWQKKLTVVKLTQLHSHIGTSKTLYYLHLSRTDRILQQAC
jgi:hypothetical protein